MRDLITWFLAILVLVLENESGFAALILSLRNHHNKHHTGKPMFQANNQSTCALFLGTWVVDDSYPLYQSSNCPIIDPRFACQKYGRPDSDYLKYRWKPLNCELPRFNGLEFLVKMRGKTVMFVGDSLGRNQWESLICIISASLPSTSSPQMSGGETFSNFKILDYGVSIAYYKAPYLVDIDVIQGKRTLKLEDISGNANVWRNADVLVFNTGHWWSHQGSLKGWDLMESGGSLYQDMDRLVAMEKGLRTWANWVDSNIDSSTTKVFFMSISPTHNSPNEWSAGEGATVATTTRGNCYGETAPTSGTVSSEAYTDQMRVIDNVIRDMHNPAYLLDITMLSQLRKDCHPSIYSGELTAQQKSNPYRSADCSHWCLPGLPDAWNQLFYTVLFF